LSSNPREKALTRSIELRKILGAKADDTCEVDFFFYADQIDDALDLMNTLRKMNYTAECHRSDKGSEKFLITGNTPLMNMQSNEMLSWSNYMDDLAAEFNCKFDGWGALVESGDTSNKK
jgi:hypothetical protein